jgi:hypothetical protein
MTTLSECGQRHWVPNFVEAWPTPQTRSYPLPLNPRIASHCFRAPVGARKPRAVGGSAGGAGARHRQQPPALLLAGRPGAPVQCRRQRQPPQGVHPGRGRPHCRGRLHRRSLHAHQPSLSRRLPASGHRPRQPGASPLRGLPAPGAQPRAGQAGIRARGAPEAGQAQGADRGAAPPGGGRPLPRQGVAGWGEAL